MKCRELIEILNMLEDKDREICIFFDDNIYDISKKMALKKIRRIPIVANNKLVGMVSIADIAVTRKFDTEIAEAISEISK